MGASASEAASGFKEAASGISDSVNQATSGAVDSALSVYKELSNGVGKATSSVQVQLGFRFHVLLLPLPPHKSGTDSPRKIGLSMQLH